MSKPSKHEAIRFHGFVFRHFGNSSSSDRGQTWYLYDDNRIYQKYHNAIFDSKNFAKRNTLLIIDDLYELFKEVEKKFGQYGTADSDEIGEYLFNKLTPSRLR